MGGMFSKVCGVKVMLDGFYCDHSVLLASCCKYQIMVMQMSLFLIMLLIYSGAH